LDTPPPLPPYSDKYDTELPDTVLFVRIAVP